MAISCKLLLKDLETLAGKLNIDLKDELLEYITEKTEKELALILKEAENIANSKKRKTVMKTDILEVMEQRNMPFEHLKNK